jgi:hypothetical protein
MESARIAWSGAIIKGVVKLQWGLLAGLQSRFKNSNPKQVDSLQA